MEAIIQFQLPRIQRWKRLGQVFTPDSNYWWQQSYGILPTPWRYHPSGLEILYASTDKDQIGRVSSCILSLRNEHFECKPTNRILLDSGELGRFDDCGVNPSCIVNHRGESFLFYVGYQRHDRTPYSLLPGIARWDEASGKFKRAQRNTVFPISESEFQIRTAPFVIWDKAAKKFRAWYVAGESWMEQQGHIYPVYGLKHMRAASLHDWPTAGESCCGIKRGEAETGFGRPWVIFSSLESRFYMWFSVRTLDGSGKLKYRQMGFAESSDGLHWTRDDSRIQFAPSQCGWDSEMICYASFFVHEGKLFMLYNGNENGKTGFGLAHLDDS